MCVNCMANSPIEREYRMVKNRASTYVFSNGIFNEEQHAEKLRTGQPAKLQSLDNYLSIQMTFDSDAFTG